MQIEIRIDSACREPKAVILTDRMTDEVRDAVKRLSEEHTELLAGFREGTAEILEPARVYRCYTENGAVLAETEHGAYALRLRLYELEERLGRYAFVRISNAELVNLKLVRGFDLSIAGTICVTLKNGTVTYVSRRYVGKIKQVLGI